MAIRIVRLGSPRHSGEGVRLGTVRRPPRGVRKEDFAGRNYFDVWLPELAPSAPVVSWALSQPFTPSRWKRYARLYRSEMSKAPACHMITTLSALSRQTDFSVGCYCEKETLCHRFLLGQLLIESGADVLTSTDEQQRT